MGGLFRKKASEKEDQLRKKRETFFTRQRNQEDGSGSRRTDGSQAAAQDRARKAEAPGAAGFEERAAQTDVNVRSQEKEAYMIRCPKCGKMVNRDRVARRKYI